MGATGRLLGFLQGLAGRPLSKIVCMAWAPHLPQEAPGGVLHISDGVVSAAELRAAQRRAQATDVPVGARGVDVDLGGLADAVGRGVRWVAARGRLCGL